MTGISMIIPVVIMNLLPNVLNLAGKLLILKHTAVSLTMVNKMINGDLSEKMRIGFERARLKLLEQEAKNDGFLVISDKEGNIRKVPAKELLSALKNDK